MRNRTNTSKQSIEAKSGDVSDEPVESQPAISEMGMEDTQESESDLEELQDLSQSRILPPPPPSDANPESEFPSSVVEVADTIPPLPPLLSQIGLSPSPDPEAQPLSDDRLVDEEEPLHRLSLQLKEVFNFEEVEEIINGEFCPSVLAHLLTHSVARRSDTDAFPPRLSMLASP
jgi:hypothetical protein